MMMNHVKCVRHNRYKDSRKNIREKNKSKYINVVKTKGIFNNNRRTSGEYA